MNTGRNAGIILVALALIIFVAAAVLFGSQLFTEETATVGGSILGIVLVLLFLVLPLGAAGVYMLMKGRGEESQMSKARQQRKILDMVLAQGKVRFDEVALELNENRDTVEDMIRDLVGKQLFTGAVNWNEGLLYSKEASQLKADHKCPNCGGELELAGKGVIQCPFCGSQVFMHLN